MIEGYTTTNKVQRSVTTRYRTPELDGTGSGQGDNQGEAYVVLSTHHNKDRKYLTSYVNVEHKQDRQDSVFECWFSSPMDGVNLGTVPSARYSLSKLHEAHAAAQDDLEYHVGFWATGQKNPNEKYAYILSGFSQEKINA